MVTFKLCQQNSAYKIGDDGSVWGCLTQRGVQRKLAGEKWRRGETWHRMAPKTMPKGYLLVNLCGKMFTVHRLVLETFVGPRPAGMEARHKNGIPSDNRLCNLAWGTRTENYEDRVAFGTHVRGEKNPCAKLNEIQVEEIRSSKETQRALAKKYQVSQSVISNIRTRKRWSWSLNTKNSECNG